MRFFLKNIAKKFGGSKIISTFAVYYITNTPVASLLIVWSLAAM